MTMKRIISYTVESENFESIHNHSAYARIDGDNSHQANKVNTPV